MALDLPKETGVCARRKIVDVSGDGRQKYMRLRHPIATLVICASAPIHFGITINALAIETEDDGLAENLGVRVVLREMAFGIPIWCTRDFGAAIIEKLQRELMATGGREDVPRRMQRG
jgi:hypothetical protein